VDFEDRRIGSDDRFSGLSEGQRYALALVLNLAFVGVVIAGFAFLYTSGFDGGERVEPAGREVLSEAEGGPVPLPSARPPRTAVAALEDRSTPDRTVPIASDAPPEEAERIAFAQQGDGPPLDELQSALETALGTPPETALETASESASESTPDSALEDDEDSEETVVAAVAAGDGAGGPALGAADDEASLVAAETIAEPETAASPPEDPPAPETTLAALGPTPRLAPPRTALANSSRDAPVDPTAGLWSTAGSLAASLQRDFACSQFTLQADPQGRPALRARVGYSDDIDLVRTRVSESFADLAVVEGGLGCTTVVGGGYVALSDENGRVSLLDQTSLSREIRAVLPGDGTCALIGQVVTTQPPLLASLTQGGRAATWVRSGGEPALCESTPDGMWQIVSARTAPGRRAAALVLGDDVIATEARRAANLGAAPAALPATTPYDVAAIANPVQDAAAPRPSSGGVVEVAPLDGPSPRLPAGVERSEDGYAVTISFRVDREGKAEELSVLGAGMAGVAVVAAALEVVEASSFPPAQSGTYRATHTVRFPSAEFEELLSRLSLATASERDASPIWDREPTQADYDRHYPARALRRGLIGRVEVDCRIAFDGRLACAVASESPSAWGFGGAALSLAELMRAAPRMTDGGPSANETVNLEFMFTPDGVY
jgi:TonB family protein